VSDGQRCGPGGQPGLGLQPIDEINDVEETVADEIANRMDRGPFLDISLIALERQAHVLRKIDLLEIPPGPLVRGGRREPSTIILGISSRRDGCRDILSIVLHRAVLECLGVPAGCRRCGGALSYASAGRPEADGELFVDTTLLGRTHGATGNAYVSHQIPLGRSFASEASLHDSIASRIAA